MTPGTSDQLVSQVNWALDAVGAYLIFGLAVYALLGLSALFHARREERNTSLPVRWDILKITACFMICVFLEAVRCVWDSFHPEHFPIWITRLVLIVVLPTIGNCASRLYHTRRQWFRGE